MLNMILSFFEKVMLIQQVPESAAKARARYYDFFANPAATSQSSYKVITMLHLFYIEERILHLIYDVTIIPTCRRYMVINCYLGVIIL